jgi:predicted Zn finger-like uncharacterized protein
MNYTTSCPVCETQFLLTKDHLKAYRGKVQCGHCDHVFNAKNRLVEVSDDIQSVDEYTAAEQDVSFEENNDIDKVNSDEVTSFGTENPVVKVEPTYAESMHAIEQKPIGEVLNVVLETEPNLSDLSAQNEFNLNPDSDSPYISSQTPASIVEEDINIDAVRAPIFIEDLTVDPNFQFNKPKCNIWLIQAAVLLLIVALLQSIYFLRSTIAVNYPQLKPHLEQACRYLKCTVSLPQNLDLLTIDDSDMQESDDYQDVINFSCLIINNARHAQAFPNIEFTLTNIDDKPVLRKLLRPQEYLNSGVNIIDGMIAGEEVRINLALNVQNLSVTSYRVLLSY